MATSALMRVNRDRPANASCNRFQDAVSALICGKTGLNPGWWQLLSQPPHGFLPALTAKIDSFVTSPTPCFAATLRPRRPLPQRPQGDLHRFGCAPPVRGSRACPSMKRFPAPTSARPQTPQAWVAPASNKKMETIPGGLLRCRGQKPPATSIASSAHWLIHPGPDWEIPFPNPHSLRSFQ